MNPRLDRRNQLIIGISLSLVLVAIGFLFAFHFVKLY